MNGIKNEPRGGGGEEGPERGRLPREGRDEELKVCLVGAIGNVVGRGAADIAQGVAGR